ncbi:MAG: peptidyl-prolyl cis-trans isomerase [Pseudomonadota bacterium]
MVKEFDAKTFGMKPGEISAPFQTQFGWHIVKLIEKIPAGPKTVERLKPELLAEWKREYTRKPEQLDRFFKKAEPKLEAFKASAGTKAFRETKREATLRYFGTAEVETTGSFPGLVDPADSGEILRAAQSLASGAVSTSVRVPSGNLYLVRVVSIRPSRVPALAEVRTKVSEGFLKNLRERALAEYASNLLAKWIASGKPIGELAKSIGLIVEETGEFPRSFDNRVPKLGMSESVMKGAFLLTEPKPFFTEPVQTQGGVYLLALKKRVRPDWAVFEKEREGLRATTAEDAGRDRLEQWSKYLRTHAKVDQPIDFNAQQGAAEPPLDY